MSTPTEVNREYLRDRMDAMGNLNARLEEEARAIIEEKAYDNGLNLLALFLKAKTEEIQALIVKLRQASHARYGSSEEAE